MAISKIILLFVMVFISFLMGAMIVASYANHREVMLYGDVLVGNLAILSDCKKHHCDEGIQKILITNNDIALYHSGFIERAHSKNLFMNAGQALTLIFIQLNTDHVHSNTQIVDAYSKLGCGIKGMICQP